MKEINQHKKILIAIATDDTEAITEYFINAPIEELRSLSVKLNYSAKIVKEMYLKRLEFEKGN